MEADMSLLQEAETSLTTSVELTSLEFACYAEKSMNDSDLNSNVIGMKLNSCTIY